jgi:hypothetical protein
METLDAYALDPNFVLRDTRDYDAIHHGQLTDPLKEIAYHAVIDNMRDVFVDYHTPIKMVTLPGTHWTFEHGCMERFKNIEFIGIESNKEVYEYSDTCKPANSRLYNMTTSKFVTKMIEEHNSVNCLWYDWTGTFSPELQTTLNNTHLLLDTTKDQVPLAITFCPKHYRPPYDAMIALCGGRDANHRKANCLAEMLETADWWYDINEVRSYPRGAYGKGRMVLVTGIMRKKIPLAVDERRVIFEEYTYPLPEKKQKKKKRKKRAKARSPRKKRKARSPRKKRKAN